MGRRWWWGSSNNWGWKKNRHRSSWGWRRDSDWDRYNLDRRVDLSALGIGTSFSQPSQSQPSQSQSVPSYSQEVVIDVDDDDEMGHDDLDDEVYFGQLRGNIVGIQYYRGTVNKKEMVALVREPHNPYDCNAIKVNNVDGVQVGHIKRELAKPLAFITDKGLARLEGIVPFGQTNVYSMPIDITLWGKPEHQAQAVAKLKQCGYYLTGGTPIQHRPVTSSQGPSSSQGTPNHAEPRRTFLTPAEVKNELDKLFENIKEGDKTSITDPAKAIVTTMYPHQKQALCWMMKQENSQNLPPFWEMKGGQYFNTVLNYQRKDRPESVRGGILADDMGLGKTLEMIALIVTNFTGGQPLAVPIEGLMRQRKSLQDITYKAKYNHAHQSKSDYHIEEPVKVKRTVTPPPELPSLPEDDNDDTPDVSDDEPEPAGLPELNANLMLKKDDPDFSPGVKTKGKKKQTRKSVPAPATGARHSSRSTKKPVRYSYSSGEDDDTEDDEADIQAAVTASLVQPESTLLTNKAKEQVAESVDPAPPETSSSTNKDKTPSKKGKTAKGKGKKAMVTDSQSKSSGVMKEITDTQQSDVKEDKSEVTRTPRSKKAEIVEPEPEVSGRRSRRATKRPARYTYSSEEDELINEETPKKKVKPIKKEKGKASAKSKGQKKGIKSTETMEMPAEDVKVESELTSEEKENHNYNNNNIAVKTGTVDDVKVELKAVSVKEVESAVKTEVEDLPDLDTPLAEPDPGVPTVLPNYTKPGEAVYGTTTGRTAADGPRATLIVCPLSVLSNWLDQFETHVSPFVHLNIYLYYGANREKNANIISQQDVVLTTYSTISSDAKMKGARSPLKRVKWLRIVLDEGHAIKNPNSQQTKAICELQAVRKWVLTGTPIQNSMKDLWSLMNFLRIDPFTDKQWWRRTIERPLEKGDKTALVRVQHLMANIALRRTKTQMVNGKPIVQLPKRDIFIEHVKLSEEEKTVYEAMQNEGKLIVSKYFRQGTLLHNYGDVLAILMRLRQLCCHPFLVAKAAEVVKETLGDLEKTGGLITEELREKLIGRLVMVLGAGTDEECAICLESLNVPVITHCAHVFCRPCIESVIQNERPHPRCPLCRGDIEMNKLLEVPPEELNEEDNSCKDITSETWKSSAKCDALMNALLKLRSEDHRAKSIVVSQFTSLLTLLEIPLRANGFNFVRFDGTMSSKARTEAIEVFSDPSPDSPTIFLMSLKAGGVGINLTAASRVFLIDPAWNPASEDQCFDRCHRLGQTKDVVITKFIVENSVEERMMELQDKKRQLMHGAFGVKLSAEQKRQARIKDIKCLLDM